MSDENIKTEIHDLYFDYETEELLEMLPKWIKYKNNIKTSLQFGGYLRISRIINDGAWTISYCEDYKDLTCSRISLREATIDMLNMLKEKGFK